MEISAVTNAVDGRKKEAGKKRLMEINSLILQKKLENHNFIVPQRKSHWVSLEEKFVLVWFFFSAGNCISVPAVVLSLDPKHWQQNIVVTHIMSP